MKQKIYFITGVNGVGKSAIMSYLKEILPRENYDIRDFDERGVPDGADHSWRMKEVEWWISRAVKSIEKGVTTIICGFTKHKDFQESDTLEPVLILLDAEPEVIRDRLIKRYTKDGVFDENQKVIGKPVNEFIANNVYYCKIMRTECKQKGCPIIDTNNLSPREVAEKVAEEITR